MKKNYKEDFWKLAKKNSREIKDALKFYPKEKFLKDLYKENQILIKDGRKFKTNSEYKRAYNYSADIMYRYDDWIFKDRLYVKTLNKPQLSSKNLERSKAIKILYHLFEFSCGDLYLRENVDSNNDILFSYKKIEKYFKSLKSIKIDKFRWGMSYSFPKKNQIKLIKNSQKFNHNLSLNNMDFHPVSYNFYYKKKDIFNYPAEKNTLLFCVNLLNQNIDPIINFIKSLKGLKKIEFNDSIVSDEDGVYNSSNQSVNFPVRYRDKFNNRRFLNPYANDWEFGHDSANDKIIINNLKKLKESLDKKITFYFNSIDYYSTSVQKILKQNGIIEKHASFKGIYYD